MSRRSTGGEGMSGQRRSQGNKSQGARSPGGKGTGGPGSKGSGGRGKAPGARGPSSRNTGGRDAGSKAPGSRGVPSKGLASKAAAERSGPPESGTPSRRGKPQGRGGKRSPAAKRGLGGDHVEGRQAVRELLLAGRRRVREIVMIEDMDAADILEDINELSFEMKIPLRAVPRRRFESEALTESHQGVMARADPLPESSLEDLAQMPNAHILVLDGVTDPGNLGALLRTAECAGVTGIVLAKHRAVHISPTVTKTAAGAVEHLAMAVVGGIPTAIKDLTDLGVVTVGLDMEGDTSIFGLPLGNDQPVALVLGAEGKGLGRLVKERVDVRASIPMLGELNSLNVAMAGAIAMFEVVRRREA